jgi:two-component system, OmpR family, response regulator
MLEAFIVEDSPLIREQLSTMLEDLTPVKVVGHADTERGAASALQGSAKSATLVVVDVILREGTGLGLLRNAAVHVEGRHFVVLTNYATNDIREEALRLGADRVFDKSRQIDQLIDYCDQLAAA